MVCKKTPGRIHKEQLSCIKKEIGGGITALIADKKVYLSKCIITDGIEIETEFCFEYRQDLGGYRYDEIWARIKIEDRKIFFAEYGWSKFIQVQSSLPLIQTRKELLEFCQGR